MAQNHPAAPGALRTPVSGKTFYAYYERAHIMELARLILEYLQALVWPILVLAILFRYRQVLDKVVAKLRDADEVTAFGVGWKLRKELHDLSDRLPPEAQHELRERVAESAIDEVRLLARQFEAASLEDRHRVVADLEQLGLQVPFSRALDLTSSVLVGERVAAGIVLGVHLRAQESPPEDGQLFEVLRRGLGDPSSFVRYRYTKILQAHPSLAERLEGMLKELTKTEKNRAVRRAARKALQHVA